MSSYLDEPDSDAEDDNNVRIKQSEKVLTDSDLHSLESSIEELKQRGNTSFSNNDYETAILLYTEAITSLKQNNQPPNSLLHLNRSASYLSVKSYVKALHDANLACEIDENNWKGHWRKGLALMGMTRRPFRTKEAIKSFQRCLVCSPLPPDKKVMIETELKKTVQILSQQDAETGPPDLSRCAPS